MADVLSIEPRSYDSNKFLDSAVSYLPGFQIDEESLADSMVSLVYISY